MRSPLKIDDMTPNRPSNPELVIPANAGIQSIAPGFAGMGGLLPNVKQQGRSAAWLRDSCGDTQAVYRPAELGPCEISAGSENFIIKGGALKALSASRAVLDCWIPAFAGMTARLDFQG
jgi:hypothetical protein